MTARTARLLLIGATFLASLAGMLAILLIVFGPPGTAAVATNSAIGGPFRLTDHNGAPITDQDLKGRPTLIFFGFTHCPDVCPTTLFEVSEVLRALGSDAKQTRALFVTVDPERDTPATMKDYLSSFDPGLVGVTGDPSAIAQMLKAYRVYSKKVPTEGGYTMDHTALVYLMDKQGRFVAPFNMKRKPQELAADLRRYL
jgi:protein SCO1/2